MEYQSDVDGISCKPSLFIKILAWSLWVLAAILFNTSAPAEIHVWLFWIIVGGAIVFSTRDYILFEDGIEVKFLAFRTFVTWDNVQSVYHNPWKTKIYIKNVTPPNRFVATLVNTGIISPWYENYDLVVQILEERSGKFFFGTRVKKKKM
jgi:hypothetical protein